ncbi:MaoC family dehydratase N-terminal domain-containing protein [Nocardia puris]|uniref:Acyl dehydratase n=1 Tax=Nocardia puris TaxID=208602 RepID=A0A366DFI1_9NOCA|nr:MaoC/PaaZ C-terminal domain-containing protein [Nocardia puris]MBF6212431.1 MaoC family dehydratase N-terminal domain-containing protein [Nocardia puris]MBF6366678.1 MaoC family dehydratase N-terminal domain-containing protein [Nocardia puris]MBF6461020.1 MaoC family dehydratase N-terminal domain-containing protein [Nocardia puris]RBO88791.1 acyl dehydratase [Nocardia puris]
MTAETTARVVEFDDAGLNTWSDDESFEVTAERIAEYAAATNDPIEAHRAGAIASPVFAIVPVFEAMMMPVIEVAPMDIFGRVVHGEQDFHFHRPIRPGDKLVSRARAIGYAARSNGSTITIHIECRAEDGELVNEQYLTAFFRGIDAGKSVGEAAPPHKFDEALREREPLAAVAQHVDDDQTFRYSPASGDPVPIHLDEQVAKDAGLPGIIAHGLCTMAFASWAVLTEVAGSDVSRLRRFTVRFAGLVFPGDDLETRVWRAGSADGVTTYAFETVRGTDVVLSDGLAEIAD